MPRIPIADAPGVALGALPTPQESPTRDSRPGPGLDQLGKGLSQVGQTIAREEEKARTEADDTAVDLQLAEHTDLNHKHDVEFRLAKGEDALAQKEVRQQQLLDDRQQRIDKLANDRQKKIFAQRSQQVIHSTFRDFETHEASQWEDLKRQSEEAVAASARKGIALYAQDKKVLDPEHGALAYINQYLSTDYEKKLAREGVTGTERITRIEQEKARLHGIVMQNLLVPTEGRPDYKLAKAYYDLHSDELSVPIDEKGTTLAAHFAPIVRQGDLRDAAEGEVSRLLREHSQPVLMPDGSTFQRVDEPNLSGAIETRQLDPDTKELVRRLGNGVASTATEQWTRQQRKVYSDALGDYLRQPSRGMEALESIPVEKIAWMQEHNPEGLRKLEEMAKHDDSELAKERKRTGVKPAKPPAASLAQKRAFNEFLLDIGAHGDKYAAEGYDINALSDEWLSRMHEKDHARASKEVSSVKAKVVGASNRSFVPAAVKNLVITEGKNAGWWKSVNPKKWGDDEAEFHYELMKRMEEAAQEESKGGALPKAEWYSAWIKENLKAKVLTPGRIWGTNEIPRIEAEIRGKEIVGPKAAPPPPPAPTPAPAIKPEPAPFAPPAPSPKAAPAKPNPNALLPPGVPRSFIDAVQARAGGASLSPAQLTKLWEKNKGTWKGAK